MPGTPLVLIGGTLCDDRLWAPMLEGWRPDALALTAGLPDDGEASPTMKSHVAFLLRSLPPRMNLVGFSLGGLVALEIAAQAPGRVSNLVLICAGAGPEVPEGAAARRDGEAAAAAHGMASHAREELLPRYALSETGGTVADTLVAMAVRIGSTTYRRQNDIAITRADSRPRLGHLSMPVLLIAGDMDPLCPASRHAQMARDIPDASRIVVAGAGHMLPLEAPDILRAAITGPLTD